MPDTTMRTFANKLPNLLAAGVLGATLTGCVDNNTSIFILGAGFPDPGQNCVCGGDLESDLLTSGIVDTNQRAGGYTGCLVVGNQMIGSADDGRLRVESNRVTLFEAEVEVFDFESNSISSFSQPITGFIDTGGGQAPSIGGAIVTMIDQGTLGVVNTAAGGQTVVSRVRLFGESLGGNDVETGLFDFPITVCNGCLPCADPPADDCDDADVVTACRVGQDTVADCRCVPTSASTSISTTCPDTVKSCVVSSE